MKCTRKRLMLLFFLLIITPCLLLGAENEPGKADGVMRLVEEKTLSPDEMAASLNGGGEREGWEPEPPEIIGLNLIVTGLPEKAAPVDIVTLHGGEWWLQQRLDDRPMLLESRRLPAAEFHEIAVEHHITLEWPLAREIRVEPFPELAEKLTYPVLKAEFLNGENEDTDQFAAAMIFTDDWSFWFVVEADADAETSDATIKQEMEKILLGVDFVKPENGDFLPGPGLAVYAIDGLDEPDGSPSLMDALIRIKKTVSPEDSYSNWIGDGRLAYRFDGVGEVAGGRALTFSFGSDSADEFTAVRHFAVNDAGAVYAKVAAEDTEYRRVDEALPQLAGRYVKSGGEEENAEDSGEPVAQEFPLVNKLGFTLAFLRTDYGSDLIAENVADGATVMLDDVAWAELQGGSSLLVKNAEDESDAAPPLLFLHTDFPDEADSLALALSDGIPELRFFEDGRQIDKVVAGLPLEYLLYALESGMELGKYAHYMTPLEADGWESYPFAVRTGLSSWRLLPPGPVFTEDADGVSRLSAVSFGQDNRRIDVTIDPAGAFGGLWHSGQWLAAKTAEEGKGLAERYVLNDDGSFVRASSDFVALEQERELFAAGTWIVTDNVLLLNVRERWSLPVGGVDTIARSDTVTVVDGVVKRTCNPPEKEVFPIARAAKDPETGRLAITIDGTTYYNFDGQADLLKRYDELRRAQKIDFSNLKNVLFTFSSGAGAWRTTLAIQPDGTFNGQYSDANMGEQGDGYPNGTVYVCNFSGAFSSLEKADEDGYAYTLKCAELSQEGTPEEEKIIDGVRYVNAEPYGLKNAAGANACTLYFPGTPYEKLPETFFLDRGDEPEAMETRVLESCVLRISSDGSEDSHDEYFYGAMDDSDYRWYYIYWTEGEG